METAKKAPLVPTVLAMICAFTAAKPTAAPFKPTVIGASASTSDTSAASSFACKHSALRPIRSNAHSLVHVFMGLWAFLFLVALTVSESVVD